MTAALIVIAVLAFVIGLNNAAWLLYMRRRDESERRERQVWAERVLRPHATPQMLLEDLADSAPKSEVVREPLDEIDLVGSVQPYEGTD